MAAYWVYEDGKRIESSDPYVWKHIHKLETSVKMLENLTGELDERIKKLEEIVKDKFLLRVQLK